jgi:xanthine dehydrogenase YagR molybdenum-binding subunit
VCAPLLVAESDAHINPLGSKGVGEIGIVGLAANASYHATGKRVRDLSMAPTTVARHD